MLYIDGVPISGVELIDESALSFSIPALGQGTHDVKVENPSGETHTLLAAISAEPEEEILPEKCKEIVFYFDMDDYKLDGDAQALLDDHKDCFAMDYQYRIEGHCDERGTTAYNLSLGLKRAEIVQKYLESVGVGNARIETVSYGEEKPISAGNDEDSWAKNRRAVIWVVD
ncbi:MAG: OmpA family protein [Myxococcota bacterium]|nr:OmpA family protein [Myxococcota bacterium]